MPILKVKLDGVWAAIGGVSGHVHDVNDITNLPTSLPANGGDADTLDGKHASDFATASDVEGLKTLVGDVAVSEQIGTAVNSLAVLDNDSGCYYRITNGEVEWINPPMMNEVEYRTTKRRQGVPVYTKLVCGSIEPAESTSITLNGAVGLIPSIKASAGDAVYYDIFNSNISDSVTISNFFVDNNWTINLEYSAGVNKPLYFIATFEYTKE